MSLKQKARDALKTVVKSELGKRGIEIRQRGYFRTAEERLKNLRQVGFNPSRILDGGAHVGGFSVMAHQVFDRPEILMVEPNPDVESRIWRNVGHLSPKPQLLLRTALGKEAADGHLHLWNNQQTGESGASLLAHRQGDAERKVPVQVRRLDAIAKEEDFLPDMVKLDLQGFERDALLGAEGLMGDVEVFMVEFGVLDAYVDRTTPADLMEIFYNWDYRLYDVLDLVDRPYDGALLGGDFIFVHTSSAILSHKLAR